MKRYFFILTILSGLTILATSCKKTGSTESDFYARTNHISTDLKVQLAVFDEAHLSRSKEIDLKEFGANGRELEFEGAKFQLNVETIPIANHENAWKLTLKAKLLEGEISDFCLGLSIDFENWSIDNYLLMPGSAYNGNRYKAVESGRKHLTQATECSPDMEPVMTTIPRLSIGEGNSFLGFLSGDMSTPSVGVQIPSLGEGLFLLTGQGTKWGDYSYTIQESNDRQSAEWMIRMPGLREDSVQLGREKFYPSPDRGANLKIGDEIEVSCLLYFFDAPDVQSLFDEFLCIRKDIGTRVSPNQIPYSAAWEFQEEKYNNQNWVKEYGYYSVGMREVESQDWQTAWVGGLNTVFPLLVNGDETTRSRALQTFDFVFDTVSASGFPFGRFHKGNWYDAKDLSFMRYNGDALYFMLKSYILYGELYPEKAIPQKWTDGAKVMADALVRIFEEYGQFGQHVNNQTGEIVAGGTASASAAIGALALCADYYKNPKYLEIAEAAGEHYNINYVQKGFTNGGPGDIFQSPDSESAFGLLESYVVLYEVTGKNKWLEISKDIANQCASWVVSYDFRFPEKSTFNKMGMLTNGTVIANVQNKHSAPGICSLSGNSLFKLYRYANDDVYLQLIADIAKAIPQYMSRDDRPIVDFRPGQRWPIMPSGWINERVNMSDWEERGTEGDIKRGEIFGGSTWSEVASMLTYAELPGLYVVKDKGQITTLDNIEAKVIGKSGSTIEIEIFNPSRFDARVKIMAENSSDLKRMLPTNYQLHFESIDVKSNQTAKVVFDIQNQ
ncbi:MAG: hypothetical protein HC819_07805 [Cyclobacteriaceae bacterium]|nr:hypothetical protein [Cyclobacteriaceae bacterium]